MIAFTIPSEAEPLYRKAREKARTIGRDLPEVTAEFWEKFVSGELEAESNRGD